MIMNGKDLHAFVSNSFIRKTVTWFAAKIIHSKPKILWRSSAKKNCPLNLSRYLDKISFCGCWMSFSLLCMRAKQKRFTLAKVANRKKYNWECIDDWSCSFVALIKDRRTSTARTMSWLLNWCLSTSWLLFGISSRGGKALIYLARIHLTKETFFILQALLNYVSGLNIPGAVLIFLPGWNLIFALHKHLKMHPQFGKPP